MNEEKIYSQDELNKAIAKAINDMGKVLDDKTKELVILDRALKAACDQVCLTVCTIMTYCCANCLKCSFKNSNTAKDYFMERARAEKCR